MEKKSNVAIRVLEKTHWPAVAAIYEQGIASGHATFEGSAGDWLHWDAAHLKDCRLIAQREGAVLGWAALSAVSSRCVYGGVAEVSVYVESAWHGQGIGRRLLESLIVCSEGCGLWTLQAGIFPENRASLRLHEQLDFRRVGVRQRIGKLAGVWRDVVLLERRSSTVGTE